MPDEWPLFDRLAAFFRTIGTLGTNPDLTNIGQPSVNRPSWAPKERDLRLTFLFAYFCASRRGEATFRTNVWPALLGFPPATAPSLGPFGGPMPRHRSLGAEAATAQPHVDASVGRGVDVRAAHHLCGALKDQRLLEEELLVLAEEGLQPLGSPMGQLWERVSECAASEQSVRPPPGGERDREKEILIEGEEK